MRRTIIGLTVLAAVSLGACGDAATDDDRGYTKAPLEDPNLLIEAEEATVMAELGEPDIVRYTPEAEPATEDAAEPEEAPAEGEAAQVSLAEGVTQAQFDQGKQLFGGQGGCMACHGPSAGGSQLGPNLTDAEWLHVDQPTPAAIAGVIQSGVPQPVQYPAPMPPMGGASLTDDQVQALAGYIASITQG